MGNHLSIISFFIMIIAYIGVVEVFTVLFRLTGLKPEKARFQVVSLITNSGFTTKESELILTSMPRRRLARTVMLFGYLFAVTAVSLFVNLLFRMGSENFSYITLLYAVTGLAVFAMLLRSKWAIRKFDVAVEYLVRKYTRSENRNYMRVLEVMDNKLIAEIKIYDLPEVLREKTLFELDFRRRFDLNVLLIRRDKTIIDPIYPEETLRERDTVLLYGSNEKIVELFNCPV